MGETLIKYDDQMKATPWLASSWKQSDDKLSGTLKINDKVKYSNRNLLTAKAKKYSLERTLARINSEKHFLYTP